MSGSQVLFKSLEHCVPDVFVEPPERGEHLPIRYFGSLIESYFNGMAQLQLYVRSRSHTHQGHRTCAQIKALGSQDGEMLDIAAINAELLDRVASNDGRDFAVLIPVAHFIEKPEGMLIELLPSGVWGQRADICLGAWGHELYPAGSHTNGVVEYRKGDTLLVLRRHVFGIGSREGKGEIVEAIPKSLERVPDHKPQFVWQRLEQFCYEFGSPVAIGLVEDSISIAVPTSEKCLGFLDVGIRPSQFSTVT